jgi:tetratricopeptide (TPR) repeat protein
LNPRSAIALYNLGKMDVETGKPQLGISLLQQAVDAHASLGPALFYVGLGLAETGQNEQAANAFEKSLTSNPSQFIRESALYQLARIYQRLNRKTDADHALSELKTLKAKDAKGGSD